MMKPINTNKSMRGVILSGFISLAVAAGTIGWWTTTAKISGAVIASATIVSDTLSKRIQHREGGIVAGILVKNGDRVAEGQELVLLDPTETKSELAVITTALDELLVKRARLEAQRTGEARFTLPKQLLDRDGDPKLAEVVEGQQRLLSSTIEGLNQRFGQIDAQISQLQEQIAGYQSVLKARAKQLDLSQDGYKDLLKLQKEGLVAKPRVLEAERAVAAIEGEIGSVKSSVLSAETRIGEVKLQKLQLAEDVKTQALTELRDTEARINELQERQVTADSRLQRIAVKSPIAGTVYDVTVNTVGGVIAPGEVLMLIAPEGEELVLQAQVSPNDVDQVHAGQKAQVRFPAFNSQLTPNIIAEVLQVAADTTRVNDQTAPYYSVRLKIAPDELAKLGDSQLRPGMMAETFIQTEERSVLSYLLQPLTDLLPYALRES
jgi:HlyD family secretion protein